MTTPNLEDVIRNLATRGLLSHLSLAPSQDGKLWRASFAISSKFVVSFGEDADPVKAIILACSTVKMKPRSVGRATSIAATAAEIDDLM